MIILCKPVVYLSVSETVSLKQQAVKVAKENGVEILLCDFSSINNYDHTQIAAQ